VISCASGPSLTVVEVRASIDFLLESRMESVNSPVITELRQTPRQPGLIRQRSSQHHRRPPQQSQMRAEVAIHLLKGRGQAIRLAVPLDGSLEVAHCDDHFTHAAKIFRGGLPFGRNALLPRGEIVDQEWKECAVRFGAHPGGFPVEPHSIRPRSAS